MGSSNGLMVLYIILGALILFAAFCINYIVAQKYRKIAIDKGYDADKLHVSAMFFWLGIVGYLYVIALPNKRQ